MSIENLIVAIQKLTGPRNSRLIKTLNLIEPLITDVLNDDRRILVELDPETNTAIDVARAQPRITVTESIPKYNVLKLKYEGKFTFKQVMSVDALLDALYNHKVLTQTLVDVLGVKLVMVRKKTSTIRVKIRLKKVKASTVSTINQWVEDLINYVKTQQGDHATRLAATNNLISNMVMQTTPSRSSDNQGLGLLAKPDVSKYRSLIQDMTSSRKLSKVLERHLKVRLHVTIVIEGPHLNGSIQLKQI